jgi:hypothetical protein
VSSLAWRESAKHGHLLVWSAHWRRATRARLASPLPESSIRTGLSATLDHAAVVGMRRARHRERPTMPRREAATMDWWSELDDEIVNCLVGQESLTPDELSQKVGMSAEAVTSLLGRLAQEGRIAILRVARASG